MRHADFFGSGCWVAQDHERSAGGNPNRYDDARQRRMLKCAEAALVARQGLNVCKAKISRRRGRERQIESRFQYVGSATLTSRLRQSFAML
jgi:hypothetical protein